MEDVSRYQTKYGKLYETFGLSVDSDTMQMIRELKQSGVNVSALARDTLIPKLRELHRSIKGQGPRAA